MTNRKKALVLVTTVLWITAVIMALLISGNQSLLSTLAVFITLIVLSILAYRDDTLKDYLFGIRRENLFKSVIWGAGMVGIAWVVLKVTGLSIGLPQLPQQIGDTVRNIVVLGFAPLIETIFFQSVAFALILSRTKNKALAFWGQALIFAIAHIAAYIQGFYSYPSFVSGFDAITANIGSFFAAFLFAVSAMAIQLKLRNLAFTMIFHFGVNFVITVTTLVIFAF